MHKNVAHVDNISKKVFTALNLFKKELTTTLEDEHGDLAKRTWSFLKMTNDCIIYPLLTFSTSKGFTIKEALVLTSKEVIRLNFFVIL